MRHETRERQREVDRSGDMDDEGYRSLHLTHERVAHAEVNLLEIALQHNDPFGPGGRDGHLSPPEVGKESVARARLSGQTVHDRDGLIRQQGLV